MLDSEYFVIKNDVIKRFDCIWMAFLFRAFGGKKNCQNMRRGKYRFKFSYTISFCLFDLILYVP